MSIIAVHGPNTWGSKGTVATSTVNADAAANNGLKWTFSLNSTSTRADQDFSWAFPPNGTPTPQTVKAPTQVTYATAGSKTATLTVTDTQRTISNKALTSNVATLTTTVAHGFAIGQQVIVAGVGAPFDGTWVVASTPSGTTFTFADTAANVTSAASGGTATSTGTPAAGSYPITITAVATTSPMMVEEGGGGEETMALDESTGPFDPADHTVPEVVEYVEAHPDEVEDIYAAETAGKNRTTLLNQLEAYRVFDPADYTVSEITDYIEANPEEYDAVLEAEAAGKNRAGVMNYPRPA